MTDIALMFPGQGSQYVGMGKEFLEAGGEGAALMEMAEAVSGFPLRRLCLEGPMEELTRTMHLQPALTVMNLICWQALQRAGIRPKMVCGHSLGEYSALCAAGVLSPRDALSLVTERGRLMEREWGSDPGGMSAILGLTLAEVNEVLAGLTGVGHITAANHNTETQIVVSGSVDALEAAAAAVAERGGKAIRLKVAGANHSPLLAGAVPDFAAAMAAVQFHSPAFSLLFNVTAAEETDPDAIRQIMARQLVSPVRWLDIVREMQARRIRIFIEVGPKTVLSGLLKKILPRDYDYRCFQVDTPRSLADCLAALSQ